MAAMTLSSEARWVAKLAALNAVWALIVIPIFGVFVLTANMAFLEYGWMPPTWLSWWFGLSMMAVAIGPTAYLTWRELERVSEDDSG